MLMRIVSRRTLAEFWAKHPETKTSLQHWLSVAKAAKWSTMQAVVKTFSKAKALNGERARFEVAGGHFRMVVAFKFKSSMAFIKFIGTHKEYDKIDALKVSRY
jgi:mRNA interferase HigB